MATILIFIGSFLAAVGALFSAFSSASNPNSARGGACAAFLGAVIAGTGGVLADLDQNTTTSQLISAQENLLSWQTGGGSYPSLHLFPSFKKDGVSELQLMIHGDHPMRDIQIELTNLNDLKIMDVPICEDLYSKDLRNRMNELDSRKSRFHLPIALGNTVNLLGEVMPGEHKSIRFMLNILATNGQFTVRYHAIRKGPTTVYARETTKEVGNKSEVLLREVDLDFPRTKDGTPDWKAEFVK